MNEQKIIYIGLDHLHPHPKNPRQSMSQDGLEELAGSIRMNDILQNLTVVPAPELGEGEYTIIIGHRRHAAAKMAGIDSAPCVVREMDEPTQIRTMAMENMQRKDLTLLEEAKVIQLMMDLGDSASEVAGKTGFSEGTIRNRVKLLRLDEEKFKQAENRGVPMMQFLEIADLKDPEAREKVLDAAGTNNFYSALKSAKTTQADKEKWDAFLESLKAFAKPVDSRPESTIQVEYFSSPHKKPYPKPDDAAPIEGRIPKGKVRYYYQYYDRGYYRSCYLFRSKTKEDTQKENNQAAERKYQTELLNQARQINRHAWSLRDDFVRSVSKKTAANVLPYVTAVLTENMIEAYLQWSIGHLRETLTACLVYSGSKIPNDCPEKKQASVEYAKLNPELALFYLAVRILETKGGSFNEDGGYASYGNGSIVYKSRPDLDTLYNLLEKAGYKMSDMEKALKNGTHEIFAEAKSNDETARADAATAEPNEPEAVAMTKNSESNPPAGDAPMEIDEEELDALNAELSEGEHPESNAEQLQTENALLCDVAVCEPPAEQIVPPGFDVDALFRVALSNACGLLNVGQDGGSDFLFNGENAIYQSSGDNFVVRFGDWVFTKTWNELADLVSEMWGGAMAAPLGVSEEEFEDFEEPTAPVIVRTCPINDTDISAALRFPFSKPDGSPDKDVKFCVARQFMLGVSDSENESFLKRIFSGGMQIAKVEGLNLNVVYSADGITMGRPNSTSGNVKMPWAEAAKRIRNIVESWSYILAEEVQEYQAWLSEKHYDWMPSFSTNSAAVEAIGVNPYSEEQGDWEYTADDRENEEGIPF